MRDGFVVHGAEGALGGAIGTLLVKRRIAITQRAPDEPATGEGVARALPWAYGIAWGSLLGLAVAGLHVRTAPRTLLAGAGMGALVWALESSGWLPGAGPIARRSTRSAALSLASHVLYGVAVSVPIALIDRERRRRQHWWERLADEARASRLGHELRARVRSVTP